MLIIGALMKVLGPLGAGDSTISTSFQWKTLCICNTAVNLHVEGGPEFLVVGGPDFLYPALAM